MKIGMSVIDKVTNEKTSTEIEISWTWSLGWYDEEVAWHLYLGPLRITRWRCP